MPQANRCFHGAPSRLATIPQRTAGLWIGGLGEIHGNFDCDNPQNVQPRFPKMRLPLNIIHFNSISPFLNHPFLDISILGNLHIIKQQGFWTPLRYCLQSKFSIIGLKGLEQKSKGWPAPEAGKYKPYSWRLVDSCEEQINLTQIEATRCQAQICTIMPPSVYLFICLSVYLSIRLSGNLFLSLFTYLPTYLSIYRSIDLSI